MAVMKMDIRFFGLFTVLIICSNCSEKKPKTLFSKIDAAQSGLDFINQLTLNDSVNILDNEFVYNGAGVALGDVNGDGLDDIFLAGNQVDNKLFLNQGNLKFKDISNAAKIGKPDPLMWSSGVSIIDINADGKMDVYVCNTFRNTELQRANLLYVNQGNGNEGVPVFKEMAAAYGLADTSYSSHAQFFDYDNDGDLDLFIGVNRIEGIDPAEFRPSDDEGTSKSRDILYQNTHNDSIPHPVFVDVSQDAGIRYHGYSHSSIIHDFNNDGWLDIYVANDFFSNDLVYLNDQHGKFTNMAGDVFKHFSLSSMGSDMADIDNNGQLDLFTTEMQPYYNKRKKLFQGPSSYQKEIFTRKYGFEYQYARNTLQLHQGVNRESALPMYAEMGMYAGVQETDWSWAPLFADFDNDGWQDLFITNGFPKDVTDRDFGDFRATANRLVSKEVLMAAIPEIKIPNFVFRNNGDSTFDDKTAEWGLNFGTFSNGAAYGDLDHDGDLDLVVNNIDEQVLLLENNVGHTGHYVRLKLMGKPGNASAIGAYADVYAEGSVQRKSLLGSRGYLSQPEQILHFGLGSKTKVDSIKVTWPGGFGQKITHIKIDTVFPITYDAISVVKKIKNDDNLADSMFKPATSTYNLGHLGSDHDFIDFNFQSTLPHKFSQYGPSLAVGDVNGDDLDDLFVGASRKFKQKWFIQQADGTFVQQEENYKTNIDLDEEDAGCLLFDADNDGDLDLYIARGSAQYPEGHELYQDALLINNGKGQFKESIGSLPQIRINSSAVKAADFDKDGDLDLFVGSRVKPFSYPMGERSYILRNDSTKDKVVFVDATKNISEALFAPGMVCDALWTDFNNDNWPDLILASEWQPIRFFRNDKGTLTEITDSTGIANFAGWWNSLANADIDNDGDMDYIAGNLGENTYFKGKIEEPVRIYAKDLDQNGTMDPLISYYLRDSIGIKKEYLYHPWQDVTKQFVGIRKNFNSFGEFGEKTLPEMFPDGLLDDAQVSTLSYSKTSWIENLGDGKFKMHPLGRDAQLAPVYGIMPLYLDNDNHIDLLLIGNDYGMEVQQGRADAFNGLALRNDGKGNFITIPIEESGFLVPGDGKSLVSLQNSDSRALLIASQNNDSLRVFEANASNLRKIVKVKPNEVRAILVYKDGSKNVHEFQWGSTFQSQTGRSIILPQNCTKVLFFDYMGNQIRSLQQ